MMGRGHDRHLHPSWACTLFTQLSLCLSLYMAFNIATPPKSNANSNRDIDLYFLSVCGGYRPLKQQTHLMKLMETVAKKYKIKFVVNISELGEDDPLRQNGTLNYPSLSVPWYTTKASKGKGIGYFLKQISLPHNQILDIIGLDTGFLHDFLHTDQARVAENHAMNWLMRTLAFSDSRWRIVVGYHSLMVCNEQQNTMVTTKVSKSLHQIFLKYQVNAYLSKKGCSGHYTRDEGIAYIGNLDHIDETHRASLVNRPSGILKNIHDDGFLLHRVAPLEIVSYFIDSTNKVIFKSTLHQWGKEVM